MFFHVILSAQVLTSLSFIYKGLLGNYVWNFQTTEHYEVPILIPNIFGVLKTPVLNFPSNRFYLLEFNVLITNFHTFLGFQGIHNGVANEMTKTLYPPSYSRKHN